MIDKENNEISIYSQCKLLSINRSSLYYSPLGESQENLSIMSILDKAYFETPFYGVLRLTAMLKNIGFKVNQKRTRRLMKLINWQTIYQEPQTTIGNKEHKKYPYLLRDLKIECRNQVWATDITYIPMKKGFMYLIAIIDLHSRYVVGWSLSNTMSAQWCAQTLEDAIAKFGEPEIFNSDQGSQFTSDIFIKVLTNNDIKISMDGKGRALDYKTPKEEYNRAA
ncbi:hypothetical protein AwDysgo_20220 [Bacteroidales bacterium]|nr:hypothetical protein AwDysgo_20220 [Bacteroidales bacterium]